MTTTATVAQRSSAVAAPGERFYVRMAVACLAVAVIGFAPTYWVPMVRGTLEVSPLTHLHAAFFYGWLLLFVKQTSLAASGRLVRHRELGMLGIAVATGMCFVGVATAMQSLKRLEAAGFGEAARKFSIVPVSGAIFFAILFAMAIIQVKKREIHKRLILVATVSLLNAAVGRWFLLFLAPPPAGLTGPVSPPPVAVTVLPGFLADLLIVVAMIHDRRTTGRVHPTYWVGGAAVIASQVLRVPLSATTGWNVMANWLVALSP